jgi:hypothetical protein
MPPRLNAGVIAPERGPRCIMAILKDNGRICKDLTPFPPLSYPPTGPAMPHRPESRHSRMHLRKFVCVLIMAMPRWGSLPAGPSHRFSLDSRRLQMIGCARHSRKKDRLPAEDYGTIPGGRDRAWKQVSPFHQRFHPPSSHHVSHCIIQTHALHRCIFSAASPIP